MKKNKDKHTEFSIETFLSGKQKSHTQIFGKESLDEDGNLLSFSDQAAIVTHYLTLKDKKEGQTYFDKGTELVEAWLRWNFGVDAPPEGVASEFLDAFSLNLFNDISTAPFKPKKHPDFKFIDLFAGIGGFRIAMKTVVENASIRLNGMKMQNKHIFIILAKSLLEI